MSPTVRRSPLLVCPLGGNEGQGCPVDHSTVGGGPIFTAAGAGNRDPRYQALANLVYGMLGQLGPWEDIFWDTRLAPALSLTDPLLD